MKERHNHKKKYILGMDVGSISAGIVLMTPEGSVVRTSYAPHRGRIGEALASLLPGYDIPAVGAIAVTGTGHIPVKGAVRFDPRVSTIAAARKLHPAVRALLVVGGERFGLALFDENGDYESFRSNTSCAAGTGSFLDQQASRLNLADISRFSETACANAGPVPKIASRCAVFAKTDLIHAQQEGHTIEGICDGLSFGLAKNIADTLFSGIELRSELVCAGGVSLNRAVMRHLEALAGIPVITDEHSHLYGAIGACLTYLAEGGRLDGDFTEGDMVTGGSAERHYYYPGLGLRLSEYPDFSSLEKYEFNSAERPETTPVEVDIYADIRPGTNDVYLGVDIGSTSTKAVAMAPDGTVISGLYTRTSGRPLEALQTILECMDRMAGARGASWNVLGAATTGSGRKFIGEIVGADAVIDEITAHARAAIELDPGVDTIIEIGGQDSKFTTLRNGRVTFSVMNTVCAAGTGSFIEEQARKLGCPLSEYSSRAEGAAAPLSSDRCTVFMERDLNHYLAEGYSVEEILASVLHSVRDNYLTRVATEAHIGERVFFQGATAKNRALVAAFEHRLGRPVRVSRYCHLTGALGAALTVRDELAGRSTFRGIGIHSERIPVRSEVCGLCNNHCKLRLAEVSGQTVAFGFLCGRDYDTGRYVKRPGHYDMLGERKRIANRTRVAADSATAPTVGIPAALHLAGDAEFWLDFFGELGISAVTSEGLENAARRGKFHTGAEFCAPVAAFHAHVMHLAGTCEYVFMPVYMEERQKKRSLKRTYCYYTQYSPPMAMIALGSGRATKVISPLIKSTSGDSALRRRLYRALKDIPGLGDRVSQSRVNAAYERACLNRDRVNALLRAHWEGARNDGDGIRVVLLGRPYNVLSRDMNSGIPDLFARHGVRTYFQDMIDVPDGDDLADPLLREIHWHFVSRIIKTARIVAGIEGAYPVYITSFKCTPDSFGVKYFRDIMDAAGKPYLILQLDEHDSSVGYETRIEAAIRAFRNHRSAGVSCAGAGAGAPGIVPAVRDRSMFRGRTLLLPAWDHLSCRFVQGAMQSEGIDVRLLEENVDSIRRSMRLNSGQCIPLTVMVQNCADYVAKHGLDPSRTVLWSLRSQIACNVGMFPVYQKSLLEACGLDAVRVYPGDITFTDISVKLGVKAYTAFMFGGYLRRIGCGLRPYETVAGSTDRALEKASDIIYRAFAEDRSREDALAGAMECFNGIEKSGKGRPKVVIFGDVYVRDNDVMNQGLIRVIEQNGGEVLTTPYSDLVRIVAAPYIRKWFRHGLYQDAAIAAALKRLIPVVEGKYMKYFLPHFDPGIDAPERDPEEVVRLFGMSHDHTGESMENLIKIFHLVDRYSDIALMVQTNPAYCCPSLVTEAMAARIEELTGVPVVTIEYDGTGSSKNNDVIPFLKYPRKRERGGQEGRLAC